MDGTSSWDGKMVGGSRACRQRRRDGEEQEEKRRREGWRTRPGNEQEWEGFAEQLRSDARIEDVEGRRVKRGRRMKEGKTRDEAKWQHGREGKEMQPQRDEGGMRMMMHRWECSDHHPGVAVDIARGPSSCRQPSWKDSSLNETVEQRRGGQEEEDRRRRTGGGGRRRRSEEGNGQSKGSRMGSELPSFIHNRERSG
jgi:hypothetical protein